MATIAVKDVPDELYERLKTLAKRRNRSLNSEIINCLEQFVGRRPMSPEELRNKAKALREKVKGRISPEEIERAINEGQLATPNNPESLRSELEELRALISKQETLTPEKSKSRSMKVIDNSK